ncbi:hypothetical protein EVAR_41001_1 [Eumeta japonica]|uniref:Uncharacterized protein n=1 Tax=Eumeta variegata TaxID=151549 RepID=A0A4C1XFN5_EUMVA|nr:hypothetical protein EVAR_41001_1 [Eumeta japonica]
MSGIGASVAVILAATCEAGAAIKQKLCRCEVSNEHVAMAQNRNAGRRRKGRRDLRIAYFQTIQSGRVFSSLQQSAQYKARNSAAANLVTKASQWRKIVTWRRRRKDRRVLNLRITLFAAYKEWQSFVRCVVPAERSPCKSGHRGRASLTAC